MALMTFGRSFNLISRCNKVFNLEMIMRNDCGLPAACYKTTEYLPTRSLCTEAQVRHVDVTPLSKSMLLFDTHILVKHLAASGMKLQEAEATVVGLTQILSLYVDYMNKNMVTKSQQEITVQQLLAHIGTIKKDMVILEKSEFSQLKHEYEKQNVEIQQMNQHLQDELSKLRSGVSLDLNLERSRAKEAHNVNEKAVTQLQNKMEMGLSDASKHLSILDNKIDKEIAILLATYERYRNDIIKYAGGTVLTCLGICLGFYRLWGVT